MSGNIVDLMNYEIVLFLIHGCSYCCRIAIVFTSFDQLITGSLNFTSSKPCAYLLQRRDTDQVKAVEFDLLISALFSQCSLNLKIKSEVHNDKRPTKRNMQG